MPSINFHAFGLTRVGLGALAGLMALGLAAARADEVPECDEALALTPTTAEPFIYFDGGGLRREPTTITVLDKDNKSIGTVTIQLKTVQDKPMPGCYYTPSDDAAGYCRQPDENPMEVEATLSDDFENNLVCY
ncbi:hypothetical protein [Roseibium aestuarii]|uniref:Uncharacterized protein n=1 Tax=Roseibium aestuarii TaxID=2600299 RepID=A0ABW4JPY7_9HYPH|nr:hypothetical protein [Roseibium aestuarii]